MRFFRHLRLAANLLVIAGVLPLAAQTARPPQTRQLSANGVSLSYVEQGKGAPVVFVHGAVGDLRFWEPQREAISRQYRFIAYTFRYHGTAPWPDAGTQYSTETHAADLAAFISELQAGPVHLVGLSYGGVLAAMIAATQPQLVRSLTLAEPSLFPLLADQTDAKPVLDEWGTQFQSVGQAVQAGDSAGAAKRLAAMVVGQPVETFDTLPQGLRQILLDNARTLAPMFAAPPTTVSCTALAGVMRPTLVIRGERSPEIFVRTSEVVTRCIAGSRLMVIPNASHAMSYDNPAAFNQTLLNFLRSF